MFEQIPISSIIINRPERQRKELDTGGLKESIAKRGLIQPIVVEPGEPINGQMSFTLIAGERRLQSCTELGWTVIPARLFNSLNPTERQIIELEENVKRKNLTWQETTIAVARIHELYCSADSDWTARKTAGAISMDETGISRYLIIHGSIDDPKVAQSGTLNEAYNLLLRRKERAEGNAWQELLDITDPARLPDGEPQQTIIDVQPSTVVMSDLQPSLPTFNFDSILPESMIEWLPIYAGKKFNLIHCDFPYGVNLFNSNGIRTGPNRSQMGRDEGESYDDSEATFRALTECLCDNLNKIASEESHIIFWYSNKFEIETWIRQTFAERAPSVRWARFPLIWHKSDNVGIAASPQFEGRHVYETALLGIRGDRRIVQIKSDVYACPTDKSIHTSCKPEPMLRHFFEMLVDDSTSLFDPTCGSGTALRAAESLHASRVLGLEIDPVMVKLAMGRLREERMKRIRAKEL